MSASLIEGLEACLDAAGLRATVDVRLSPDVGYDAVAFLRSRQEAAQACGIVRDHLRDSCAAVVTQGRRITFRLAPEWFERAAENLAGTLTDRELSDCTYVIDFCDPNANKALHVGHLRGIALGIAIDALHRARGAETIRQTVICDIGRSIAEALAGYQQFRPSVTPADAGLKGDELVGLCYAEYLYHSDDREPRSRGPDAPIERELQPKTDEAQHVLERWMARDADTLELWRRLRAWVIAGHESTLRRLGVTFDRYVLESSAVHAAVEMVTRLVGTGSFVQLADGSIAWDTQRSEYRLVPLLRADGFPTEHLRALVLWSDLAPALAAADGVIHVMGDEWLTATQQREEILHHLGARQFLPRYRKVAHGMVENDGSLMKSSTGDVILVDRYLDSILAELPRRGLDADSGGHDLIARTIGLLFMLSLPATKPIQFSWERLLDPKTNPGWPVVEAWQRAARDATATRSDARIDLCFALLQSHRYRGLLAHAQRDLAPVVLVKFAEHLARWYLDAARGPGTARVVRDVLAATLSALGTTGELARA